MERGMICMAWSPLAGGSLSAMAEKALAWLLKLPTPVIPVVGTANAANLEKLVEASETELSREEWYQLLIAARGTPMP
jgi:predicted oxidoreductase